MTPPVLQIILGSTRPGRGGLAVAEWFRAAAESQGAFTVELVDLAEVDLPLLDEPNHPRLGRYENDHTKRWSTTVDRADAFVFVIPEYNHSFNAATKNALDYLHNEWKHKAAGIVSYGGVSAGTRSAVALEPVLGALRMVPVTASVNIPFFMQAVDDDGVFHPNEITEGAAEGLLDELSRYTEALAALRAGS